MKTTVTIVGLGVIGGSYAQAIQKYLPRDVRVFGIDINETSVQKALLTGAIDDGSTTNKGFLEQSDLVIITLYPQAITPFVEKHADNFKSGSIIIDNSGVKEKIIHDVLTVKPETVDFIFTHPMAGRESQGFDYSEADIFQGANLIITPHEGNKEENIEKIKAFAHRIGFKRLTFIDANKHDSMIAFTSQLCHVIAVSLINSDRFASESVQFVGDSYRDLTRIAKINSPLWSELLLDNKKSLLHVMDQFELEWKEMKQAIIENNHDSLVDILDEATKRRTIFEDEDLKNRL